MIEIIVVSSQTERLAILLSIVIVVLDKTNDLISYSKGKSIWEKSLLSVGFFAGVFVQIIVI